MMMMLRTAAIQTTRMANRGALVGAPFNLFSSYHGAARPSLVPAPKAAPRSARSGLLLATAAAGGAFYSSEQATQQQEEKEVGLAPPDSAAQERIEAARKEGRTGLFPALEPYNTGVLEVPTTDGSGIVHKIYYEECGNPKGKPVVFLHGGPGGGCIPANRCFHDPSAYRIVLFDQRGCGRSTPHASLNDNTTWHLVADIERLRVRLGIDQWQVFGGSWGSTLALAYAESHPSKVTELVLRGIFMLRKSELKFYYQEGASHLFPDRWDAYVAPIPEAERHDLITAYRKRLVGTDDEARLVAARAWTQWEDTTSALYPSPPTKRLAEGQDAADAFSLAFARIENHYFHHGGFFEWDDWLLDNVDKIRHIPTVIAQGRYDVVCPAKSAWDLHKRFPEAELHLVSDSGHTALEPGTVHVLVEATERFKPKIK